MTRSTAAHYLLEKSSFPFLAAKKQLALEGQITVFNIEFSLNGRPKIKVGGSNPKQDQKIFLNLPLY